MEKLRIAGTVSESIVDGPGLRFVVFTQGCPHGCPGCHNPQTHDFEGGREASAQELLTMLDENPLLSGVTLSGGEPICQASALVPFCREIKRRKKNIVLYSGYTYEQLCEMDEDVQALLDLCDLLIDGPFDLEKKSLMLHFRGSANQRVIDLPASRKAGKAVLSPLND